MKRLLTLLLAVLMVLSTVSTTVLAEEPEEIEDNTYGGEEQEPIAWEQAVEPAMAFTVTSGFCGGDETTGYDDYDGAYRNLRWTLDSTGVLTIDGEGAMMGYANKETPWSYYKTSLKKLVIEEGVTTIGNSAFSGYTGFSGDLVIPSSVTTIGEKAFYNCSGFNGKLTIGNGVTSIGNSAFEFCSGFTGYLVLPHSVTTIGSEAFAFCSGFSEKLIIPETVQSIGAGAFVSCGNLTDVYYVGSAPNIPNAGNSNAAFDSTVTFHYLEGMGGWSTPNWKNYKTEILNGVIEQGACGENLSWMVEPNGMLTVWGEGTLPGKTAEEKWGAAAPWYPFWNFITGICITNGVENYSQVLDQQVFRIFADKGLRIYLDDQLSVSFAKISAEQKTLDFSHTYLSEDSIGYAFSCTEVLAQDIEIDWDSCMTFDDLRKTVYPSSSDSTRLYYAWQNGKLYDMFAVDHKEAAGQRIPPFPVLVPAGNALGDFEINSVEPQDDYVLMSGFCGGDTKAEYDKASEAYKNLTWELNFGGVLTISGKGTMKNYDLSHAPLWAAYGPVKVVIKDGVTSIGNYAFYNCDALTGDCVLPKSVTAIGAGAFLKTKIEKIYCKGDAPSVEKAGIGSSSFESAVTFYFIDGKSGWKSPSWNGYKAEKWEISESGDINDDGIINVFDANIVRRAAVKMVILDATQELAADVNGDGSVDAVDANIIRQYAAGLVTEFPAQA